MTEPHHSSRRGARFFCRLLPHLWTPWYPGLPGSCAEIRHCYRCGTRESSVVHDWSRDWDYERDGACDGHYTCSRCDEQQPRGTSLHVYEWGYDAPGGCDGRYRCTRCGASDPAWIVPKMAPRLRTRHRYQWEYDATGRCAGENRCTRCGDPTAEAERHDYHWLVAATEQGCRDGTCCRCAGTVTQTHDYRWAFEPPTPPTPYPPGTLGTRVLRRDSFSCVQRYECANCGRAEPSKRQEAHNWHETISSDEHYRECGRCGKVVHWPYG
jgi:hypothetical protein